MKDHLDHLPDLIRRIEREYPEGDFIIYSRCLKDDGSELYAPRAVIYTGKDWRTVAACTGKTITAALRAAYDETRKQSA